MSNCRNCHAPLRNSFADLGMSPLSNSYIERARAREMEPFYPLHAYVCDVCFLVQVDAFETPEQIFGDYAYFSSFSDSWLDHSRRYAHAAIERLHLGGDALVAEAASNDGYMLQYFRDAGLPVLGIEPARNVAAVARERGIRTESVFLGKESGTSLRDEYGSASLVIANNVIAHVPDLHDFVGGLKALLAGDGVLSIEFPHLLKLIEEVQFDTIYHEHFSYYSLRTMENVLARHQLRVWDVEEIPTHGGSLRVWAVHEGDARASTVNVQRVRAIEMEHGLTQLATYLAFAPAVEKRKRSVLRFLIDARDAGHRVAGYGAPAKGNTLLNYCGVKPDLFGFTVDRNPAKQGTLLPGTRIPVYGVEKIQDEKPDYLFILPWNIRDEVVEQTSYIRDWGGKFVVAMPAVDVF